MNYNEQSFIKRTENKEKNSEKLLHFDLKECDTKMTSSHTAPLNLHLHLQPHMCTGKLKPPHAPCFFSSN